MLSKPTHPIIRSFPTQGVAACLAGCLITLSLEPFNFWLASLLAPVILWRLITHQSKPKRAAVLGWLFGLGMFGSGVSWVFVSIYYQSATPLFLAVLLTLAFIAFLAGYLALLAYLQVKLFSNTNPLLTWPALWVLIELLRSWLFTGFPWLLLGTAQLNSPLTGWLPIVGVYGVSFLTVLTGVALYVLCNKIYLTKTKKLAFTVKQRFISDFLPLGLVLIFSFGVGIGFKGYEWTQPTGEVLQLGLVQPNIEQADKWRAEERLNILRQHLDLTLQLGELDLIIWPETSIPLSGKEADNFFQLALNRSASASSLISGLVTYDDKGNYYNSLVSRGEQQEEYRKVKLVPFGEYVPLEAWLRQITDFFNLPMSGFSRGDNYPAQMTVKDTQLAPLICYEVAYPDFSAQQGKQANWLLTVSNDAWFGDSLGPLQHLQLAKQRALEAGKPLVRVTNNGISGLVNPQGELVVSLPRFTATSEKVELQPYLGTTPFSWLTSYPVLAVSLFLLFLGRKLASRLEL